MHKPQKQAGQKARAAQKSQPWRVKFKILNPVMLMCHRPEIREKYKGCSTCFSSNFTGDSKCRADEKMEREA